MFARYLKAFVSAIPFVVQVVYVIQQVIDDNEGVSGWNLVMLVVLAVLPLVVAAARNTTSNPAVAAKESVALVSPAGELPNTRL